MAPKAKKKVKLEGQGAMRTFEDKGVEIFYTDTGEKRERKVLSKPFKISKDETQEVSAEDFEVLIEKGSVLTKEQYQKKLKLIKSQKPIEKLTDEDKTLVLVDIPHEV